VDTKCLGYLYIYIYIYIYIYVCTYIYIYTYIGNNGKEILAIPDEKQAAEELPGTQALQTLSGARMSCVCVRVHACTCVCVRVVHVRVHVRVCV